jgi:hypothetical protein
MVLPAKLLRGANKMICIKCGTHNPDDSNDCDKCGNPIDAEFKNHTESQPQQSTQPFHGVSHDSRAHQMDREPVSHSIDTQANVNDISFQEGFTHPFQKLGGWLKYMVYAPIVGIGLMAILYLFSYIIIFQNIQYLQSQVIKVLLIGLLSYGVSCFLTIKFSMMLKNRNPKFLRFYELTMIVFFSFLIITIVVKGFNAGINSIRYIIASVLNYLLTTLYFRKSVRVHIYMGNVAYLENSIFSKNAVAPILAETKQYISSQTDTQWQSIDNRAK